VKIWEATCALITIPLLNPSVVAINVGWRMCFGLGAVPGRAAKISARRAEPL